MIYVDYGLEREFGPELEIIRQSIGINCISNVIHNRSGAEQTEYPGALGG